MKLQVQHSWLKLHNKPVKIVPEENQLFRYVIKSNIVDVLVEEYKPVGFANSRYQNRLADFIHFGYYSDPKDGSEKFEVMN